MDRQMAIRIHERDNVAIALEPLKEGESVQIHGQTMIAIRNIPFGHKLALNQILPGEQVVKYGSPIGRATAVIEPGQWVHSHNMESNLEGLARYEFHPETAHDEDVSRVADTFDGYVRADGSVGIRNELWIVPTVSCVNSGIRRLAEAARAKFGGRCDGIYALPHSAGCSQLGDDHKTTQRILRGIVRHPNAGGALIVSLGCENNQLKEFLPMLGEVDGRRVKTMIAQEVEGDEIEYGLKLIDEILSVMEGDHREPCPIAKLTIGFKCGGSDAFSGVTANVLCGRIADRIAALGGKAVLTEVPEMFGAEHHLMGRAASERVFDEIVSMIDGFKEYYLSHGQSIDKNPSPGNMEGGITTLEEKSLGCIQKGGHATITGTLTYGQRCETHGLNLMTGPGNDNVSITNLVSAGAQIILFTTGRGNPLGTVAPVIKIASNSELARRKPKWIDFDAGRLLTGQTMEALVDELWTMLLDSASGRYATRNELNDSREITIFKNGVLL